MALGAEPTGVTAGDRVRTGAGAAARLVVYFEGSVIELAANTGILYCRTVVCLP
ncbi:MAG TPA: hypothetical protein VII06_35675 [Chloroflexota bacterium]